MTTRPHAPGSRPGFVAPHLIRALAIVALGGMAGIAHSLLRDKPIKLGGSFERPPQDVIQERIDARGGYDYRAIPSMTPEELLDADVLPGMITLREAHELFEEGALFLDSRGEDAFEAGHIRGALWMPAGEVLMRAEELLAFDPATPVVIYCTGGSCDASHNTASRLETYGPDLGIEFADVRIMGLGYDEWKRAGLPTSEDDADAGEPAHAEEGDA